MKRIIPIFLLAVVLSSCLDTKDHYTPEVSLSTFVNQEGDSLLYYYDSTSELWHVDSMHVGDTLRAAVGYQALGNYLISTHVTWDTSYIDLWALLTPAITDILLPQSDTVKLDLYAPMGYNYLGFPFWVVPKKAGSTSVKFTVVTDSKYSPQEEVIILNLQK